MMTENQTDNYVTELTCEEPSERIFSISLYVLITITILCALLTIILFLFTVIHAKEKVKRRRAFHRSFSSAGDQSDNPPEESPSPRASVKKLLNRNNLKVVKFADIDALVEQEEDNSSTNVTVTDPEDLYETIPKYYSNEYIQMNIDAINEKRMSETSETSNQNHNVAVLAKRVFSRSQSDDVAKFALRNALRTRDDIRQINMGGGDGQTPWPESDARRRNSTWAGSED